MCVFPEGGSGNLKNGTSTSLESKETRGAYNYFFKSQR